jgi:hypothetical protein
MKNNKLAPYGGGKLAKNFHQFNEVSSKDVAKYRDKMVLEIPLEQMRVPLTIVSDQWNLDLFCTVVGIISTPESLKMAHRIIVNSVKYN